MKPYIQLLFLLFVVFVAACEENTIGPNELPQSTQDYLSQNYPDQAIIRVDRDRDDSYCYEVYLGNGIELYFDCDGNFLEADQDCSDETGIQEGLVPYENLPQAIKDYVQQNHGSTTVCYTEKDCDLNESYVYEVVLKDGFELYFDLNAAFLFSEKDEDNNC